MTKWERVLCFFSIPATLALVAFFYYPPALASFDVDQAVAKQPIWHLHTQGQLGQETMQIDLVKHQGELWFRISYPPVKLLNNQWITLGKSNHLFSRIQFNKRLTTFKDFKNRKERYAFKWDEEVLKLFNGMQNMDGVIWFDRRSGLPLAFESGGFEGAMAYQDPLISENAVVVARSLEDVVIQLQGVVGKRNGKPKSFEQIRDGTADTRAFSLDFDQDGLSDGLEVFWGTDPANPDSDNDTHLDGEEVERGYDPVGDGKLTTGS